MYSQRAHLIVSDRFNSFALLLFLLLIAGSATADEINGGNPEDRPVIEGGDIPDEQLPCVIHALRRGAPHNMSNYTYSCTPGENCVPQLAPDNTPNFHKTRHLWIWIGTSMTRHNALMPSLKARAEDYYFGWGTCAFSNSDDKTGRVGGWTPQTKSGRCRPFDRLRSPAGRTHEYSIERGDAVPESVEYLGHRYQFTTNGQLGSDTCFAIFGGMTSPLVIDLAGKGLTFTRPGAHVEYDLGEGRGPTTWLANGSGAPFLALDLNANNVIDDYKELFGNTTPGPDNKGAKNGFQALAKYDGNADKVIDVKDAVYAKLFLWSDSNANAKTDAGELQTLEKSGISSISLDAMDTIDFADNFGNMSNGRSTAAMNDGKKVSVYDAWFVSADPLGVKGAASGVIAPHRVPKQGAKNYGSVHKSWEQAVAAGSFSQNEMPFEFGEVQTYLDKNGKVDHHVITWTHVFDTCRVEATFSADWSTMQKSDAACS